MYVIVKSSMGRERWQQSNRRCQGVSDRYTVSVSGQTSEEDDSPHHRRPSGRVQMDLPGPRPLL